jgi:AAA15 family ATPase/GTPase
MRITKIEIKGFRIFHGRYAIDLGKKGRNLLVYGENGSGKTSLYQAINLFLSARSPLPEFSSNQNIFVETDDNYIKLSLGDQQNPDLVYEWSKDANPFAEPVIQSAAKTKGFFDYKSLLETYFLQRNQDKVNIFDTLIRNLISIMNNGINNTAFGEEWAEIEELSKSRMTQRVKTQFEQKIADFQAGLIFAQMSFWLILITPSKLKFHRLK